MAKINWIEDGWTVFRENNPEKHLLGIYCRCEGGKIVEVRTRHTHGEEVEAKVLMDGEQALPMSPADFEKNFKKKKIEIV